MMAREEQESILNTFDFAGIEEMDPSLADGYKVVYDREVPFELRIHDPNTGPQEVGTLEAIRAKLLILGIETAPTSVRVELTSENDLFFHYTHNIDETGFQEVREAQKLMIEFQEYATIMVKMLNSCIKEPHSFLAVLLMQKDGGARLDFIQNMEYKFIELLSCNFLASTEEVVRQHITFRYNAVKAKLALMQARLQDISTLVKIKNPSLLLQLQKHPRGSLGSTSRSVMKPQRFSPSIFS